MELDEAIEYTRLQLTALSVRLARLLAEKAREDGRRLVVLRLVEDGDG